MTPALRLVLAAAALPLAATAQLQTVLFTGRFPFVSADSPNERPGGAITRLEEFDISHVLPVPGGAARSLLPTTALQCYLGDGNNDGIYTKFAGWKTYFQAINLGGIFVKAADRASVRWDKVFFTVRRNAAAAGTASPGALQVEVLTNNGTTPVTLLPGDYVRLLPNGNAEFFLRNSQLVTAVGLQTGAATIGAGALLQANNGDLYYAPADGSHWVNGNQGGTVNCLDGAIVKIDAANITYDAAGNVAALAPNSARLLINENSGGPGGTITTRQMVVNTGAMNRDGLPIVAAGVFGKVVGLAFDPNGGTFLPNHPDATGAFPPEPNLLFASDAGSYAGSIFSTAPNGAVQGSIATINGVLCGSLTPGVPANGSWLGVNFDYANFQPTLMGFTLCDAITALPLTIDQNGFGSLPLATSQPNWDVDIHGTPFTPTFLFLSLGPTAAGGFAPSVPAGFVPLGFAPDSWNDVFLLNGLFSLGLAVTNAAGYGTVTTPNLNTGGFTGITLMVQGIGLQPGGFQLTSPLLVQLQ
ncbi:MAG: hypothetical protein WAT39_13035 [Planctomycetota bacterium]